MSTGLRGEKTFLRPMEENDLALVNNWRNEPDAMVGSYQVWPQSEAAQRLWWARYIQDVSQERFMICQLPGGGEVGTIALTRIDYKEQSGECGIRIIQAMAGRGYATDAVKVLTAWSFGEANLHRIYSEVFEGNEASIKVFHKAGWFQEGRKLRAHWRNGGWVDILLFAILREENYHNESEGLVFPETDWKLPKSSHWDIINTCQPGDSVPIDFCSYEGGCFTRADGIVFRVEDNRWVCTSKQVKVDKVVIPKETK